MFYQIIKLNILSATKAVQTHLKVVQKNWSHLKPIFFKNGIATSITETIKNRLQTAVAKGNKIMNRCEDPQPIGFPRAIGPINEYTTKIIPKLLNNAESWLGLNDSHQEISKPQDTKSRDKKRILVAGHTVINLQGKFKWATKF